MESPSVKEVKLSPSCFINNLPIPILMEILCTMPIKTLATCKSVCKSWLHLMRDPHFSQLHQARAPSELCFQRHRDVNTTKLHMGNFNFLSNFDPLEVKLNTLFELPKFNIKSNNSLDYEDTRGLLRFANSCNGLLCYYNECRYRFALIWNPCTGEFITVPTPKIDSHYGLGYSKKANKFKLLRVTGRKEVGYVGEICTIEKACSWKTVGPCSTDSCFRLLRKRNRHTYCTFLQGTLHWFGSSESTKSDITIYTFDFEDDKFGRVPLPPSFVKSRSVGGVGHEKLGVLGGRLYITEYAKEGMSIWLLKEYGVEDSWANLFCVGYTIEKGSRFNHCVPIAYMDNGEILMTCHSYDIKVFFYNPVLKRFRFIGSGPGNLSVIAYMPSLVMLKDSMLGYDVHVCPHSKRGHPDWWKPQKHGSEAL